VDLSRVDVVLVRPSRAANVAAACRAMKNMGVRGLALVGRVPGLAEPEARALAYGAWDVLDGARRTESLAEAVSGSTLVVGTTGREIDGCWSPRQLAARAETRRRGGALSLVFGPEASGLTGEELASCHELVHVPSDPAQPSLNLAQAVLLLCYELRLASLEGAAPAAAGDVGCAPAGDLEQALAELRSGLLEIGYLDPANPDRLLGELRRLAARAGPSARELVLLRVVARQMAWAGRIARGRRGTA